MAACDLILVCRSWPQTVTVHTLRSHPCSSSSPLSRRIPRSPSKNLCHGSSLRVCPIGKSVPLNLTYAVKIAEDTDVPSRALIGEFMVHRLLVTLLAAAMLFAPAIGSVSRCTGSIAKTATCCCCQHTSGPSDCCQSNRKACCRQAESSSGAAHPCCCRHTRPQPAIPAERREEQRCDSVVSLAGQSAAPWVPPQEVRLGQPAHEVSSGLSVRRALLCRWLI